MGNIPGCSLVKRAKIIATDKHSGQVDKVGLPYILHLERVESYFKPGQIFLRTISWLHDILEDTDTTRDYLYRYFPARIVGSVVTLTRVPPYDYSSYIDSIIASGDRLAIRVKVADLLDHIREGGKCPPSLLPRYHDALAKLVRAGGLCQ